MNYIYAGVCSTFKEETYSHMSENTLLNHYVSKIDNRTFAF